jgi:hypothetical protein
VSRGMRRLALIGSGALAFLLGLPAVAGATPDEPIERVLIISVPVLTWEEVNTHRMPNLNRLLDRSAVANLTTRTLRRQPILSDGYVTLSAGTRAVGAGFPIDGEAFDARERVNGAGTAAQMFARRTGEHVDSGLVHLGIGAIEEDNAEELYDAEIGALGDALADAGFDRAVIANGDGRDFTDRDTAIYRRQAVAGLMSSDGTVPRGQVDDELLRADPLAPFGVRYDNDAVVRAFRSEWRPRSVVLVEASDLVRADAYRKYATADERARVFRQTLQRTDALIGGLLDAVDFERDAVVVVGPAHAEHEARLTLMAVRAPGQEPGLLRSGTTRRAGFVQLVDVAPTILDRLGIDRPDSMEGRAAEVDTEDGSAAERRDTLADADSAAQFRDDQVAPVAILMVVVGGLLGATTLVAFVFTDWSWLPRVVSFAALAFLGYIPAVYLAQLIPFYDLGVVPYYVFLIGLALLLAHVYERLRRQHTLDPLILALGVIVVLLITDAVVGAPLQFNGALGFSPKAAGRFTGLGNLAYAALTASAVLLAALLANRFGGQRGVRIGVALLAVVFVVDGLPFWGSDVGGILSVLPAYGVTAYLMLGLRVRPRTIVLWLGVTLVAVIGFGLLDLTRAADQRTHLGRLFERIGSDGWSGFETVVLRKANTNLETIGNSVWLYMVPMVLIFMALLLAYQRRRLFALFTRVPELQAATVGFVILAGLGYALNDSGVAVPGMMLGIANAVLVCLILWSDTDVVEAPVTATSATPAGVSEPVGSRP